MKFQHFNPSPAGRNVGDCSIRAMCAALDLDWEDAYSALCLEGFQMSDMPNSNAVFGRFLLRNGFQKKMIPDSCLTGYTVEQFADDHPEGTFVLCLPEHVVCVKHNILYDTWDSSQEIVLYYFQRED